MAIYRCEVKAIQRSAGRSSTAAAAYRSAERITDQRTGEVHDYARRQGVAEVGIVMPEGERWTPSRQELWNAAEAAEKRKDGTPAREHIVALPSELDDAQRADLVRGYAQDLANRHGSAVDYAIHRPSEKGDDRNHHAHVLRTTRQVEGDGLAQKCAVEKAGRNRKQDLQREREIWERHCNQALEKAGRKERVDHRSHTDRGDGLAAEPKQGPAATAIERSGRKSHRGEQRRETRRNNWQRRELPDQLREAERRADRARQEYQQAAKEAKREHIEQQRRAGKVAGIRPLRECGTTPGQRRDIERRKGPAVAQNAVPELRRGGNRADARRQQRGDLLPSLVPGHGRRNSDQVQQIPGADKRVAPAPKKAAPKKLRTSIQTTPMGVVKTILRAGFDWLAQNRKEKERAEAEAKRQAEAQARRQEQQRQRQAEARAERERQAIADQARKHAQARPAPAPVITPAEQFASKLLELDARAQAERTKAGDSQLEVFARAGRKAATPDQVDAHAKALQQRAEALAKKALAGDPAAAAELRAAADRLAKRDAAELANAERNWQRRNPKTAGLEITAGRLGTAVDRDAITAALKTQPNPAELLANKAASALPVKTSPAHVLKGPKGG